MAVRSLGRRIDPAWGVGQQGRGSGSTNGLMGAVAVGLSAGDGCPVDPGTRPVAPRSGPMHPAIAEASSQVPHEGWRLWCRQIDNPKRVALKFAVQDQQMIAVERHRLLEPLSRTH